jgi:hypothetical protein
MPDKKWKKTEADPIQTVKLLSFRQRSRKITAGNIVGARGYVILIQSNLAISGPGFSHCEGISEVK